MIVQTRNGQRGVVIPTMDKPTDQQYISMDSYTSEKMLEAYTEHIASLPIVAPLPEELNHLKDGEEVRGWRVKWHVNAQSYQGSTDHYFETEKQANEKYDEWSKWDGNLQAFTTKPRKVIVPVEQKDEGKVEPKGATISDIMFSFQQVEWLIGKFIAEFCPQHSQKETPWHFVIRSAKEYPQKFKDQLNPAPEPKADSSEGASVQNREVNVVATHSSGFGNSDWQVVLELKKKYNDWFYDKRRVYFPVPDQQFDYLFDEITKHTINAVHEWLSSDDVFITDGDGGPILPNAHIAASKDKMSLLRRIKPNSEQNAQASVATDDDSSTGDDKQTKQ